ncbi:MAG: phosphohydrolase [Planctomycetes bacterium]|jgi:hypothetical protein|nr:phosphohydrolase [Planctomycetota bacterium]
MHSTRPEDCWVQTYTGRKFYPLAPRVEDIHIEDIAHALSNLCRYGGHSRSFYSVAQHSVYVACEAPPQHALWGLLHDAAEAYVMDLPRPLKKAVAGYADAEARVMDAVCERFGMDPAMPEAVHRVDMAVMADEMATVMHPVHPDVHLPEPLGIAIQPMPAPAAKDKFMRVYRQITEGRAR